MPFYNPEHSCPTKREVQGFENNCSSPRDEWHMMIHEYQILRQFLFNSRKSHRHTTTKDTVHTAIVWDILNLWKSFRHFLRYIHTSTRSMHCIFHKYRIGISDEQSMDMQLFSELLSDSWIQVWTSLNIFELCIVALGCSFAAFHSRDSPGRLAIAEGDLDLQRTNILRVLEPQEVDLNFHRCPMIFWW